MYDKEKLSKLPDDSLKNLYINVAQDALAIQDACNLYGVLSSFKDKMAVISEYNKRFLKGSTQELNTNPIVKLYVEKLVHLSEHDDTTVWNAFDTVKEIANSYIENRTFTFTRDDFPHCPECGVRTIIIDIDKQDENMQTHKCEKCGMVFAALLVDEE